MLRVVADERTSAELGSSLDEIVREGARRMLAAALEAEVDAYVSGLADEVDVHGKRLVVRNGHAEARHIQTGAGAVEVRAPRVNDRRVDEATGERRRFRSTIIPPWARKSPKVAEVVPLMYRYGMSSKDFAPALEEFFGSSAGLSASVITRLTTQWQDEADRFSRRTLGSSQDLEPDRVDLRDGQASDQGDQGTGLEGGRPGHGLQADRRRKGPAAVDQRPAPRRPGPCRRQVREGGDRRAHQRAGQGGRRVTSQKSHTTGLDYFSAFLAHPGRGDRGRGVWKTLEPRSLGGFRRHLHP
jgi:hypothetical protein